MTNCVRCGSYAINHKLHGRQDNKRPYMCDVCYWRCEAEDLERQNQALRLELRIGKQKEQNNDGR